MKTKRLKAIIEQTNTVAGKVFDIVIQALIVTSLVCFSIETIPGLSENTINILNTIEVITISIFTAEYLLRIMVADRKLQFIFSFYGLVDLAAILPFYVARGIDLRSIRILRLFRLLRVFKIVRYSRALRRLKNVFTMIKEELALFLFASLLVLYISSVGIYYFENAAQPEKFKSVFHCMWWAVATLTTVGYGDMYPVTTGGKIFTFFIVLIGIGIIAVPTGLIASALTKMSKKEE